MDFANRGASRSNNPQQPALRNETSDAAPVAKTQFSSFGGKTKRSMDLGKVSSVFVLIATSLLVLVLIFGLVFAKKDDVKKESSLINANQYQAVFLASQDGQVYFGKLEIYNRDLYRLTDIYYVRVENPIQPEGQNQQSQANISLAKLGNELHAPEDVMFIAREKVLYWENLKDDGQVVSAIKKYQSEGDQSSSNSQQNTNTNSNTNTNTNNAAGTQESNSDSSQQNDTDTDTTTP